MNMQADYPQSMDNGASNVTPLHQGQIILDQSQPPGDAYFQQSGYSQQRTDRYTDGARLHEMHNEAIARGNSPIKKWHSIHGTNSSHRSRGTSPDQDYGPDGACELRPTEPNDTKFFQGASNYQPGNHRNTDPDQQEAESPQHGHSKSKKYRDRLNTCKLQKTIKERKTLKEHPAYHEQISGQEAERRLNKSGGHSYLTRYSKEHECYILSVYEQQRHSEPTICHFKIVIEDNGERRIDGKEAAFQDIHSLLGHYEVERIDPALRTIGKAYTKAEYTRMQEMEDKKNCNIL